MVIYRMIKLLMSGLLIVWLAYSALSMAAENPTGAPSGKPAGKPPIAQVPFGDRIDGRIFNYNRTTPGIATAGLIERGGIELLQHEGFNTVLDLRTAPEGTVQEKALLQDAGIAYYNIPIGKAAPTRQEVQEFAEIVENPAHGPLLIHCASANRVGTLWAMYRLDRGVPLEIALQEGRTIGMKPAREVNVTSYSRLLSQ